MKPDGELIFVFAIFLLLFQSAFAQENSTIKSTPDNCGRKTFSKEKTKVCPEAKSPEPGFEDYIKAVMRKVRSNWKPPLNTTSAGSVRFKINLNGTASDIRTEAKKGSELEKALMNAIRKSAPFAKPPADQKKPEPLDIKMSFDYMVFSGK